MSTCFVNITCQHVSIFLHFEQNFHKPWRQTKKLLGLREQSSQSKIEWEPNLLQNKRSTRFIWVFIALGIYSCFKKYDMISVSHLLLYLYFVNSVTSRKHSSEGIICANFHWYYHDLIDSNWWNCSNVQYLFSMVPEFSLQNDF